MAKPINVSALDYFSSGVDSNNRANSIMGPECSFCRHRLRWHDHNGCSCCGCATFDEGMPAGSANMVWHQLIRRHTIDNLTTIITVGERQRRDYHFRCSCGKEWRGKYRTKYYEDHGPA